MNAEEEKYNNLVSEFNKKVAVSRREEIALGLLKVDVRKCGLNADDAERSAELAFEYADRFLEVEKRVVATLKPEPQPADPPVDDQPREDLEPPKFIHLSEGCDVEDIPWWLLAVLVGLIGLLAVFFHN